MGDFGPVRDKWVCPNDRELSLRAKLKTGWSVKTSSINSFGKPEPLNDKEQEAIMNVIKRAENLDKVEQERVGRLVERLDNMKKNAMGNGTTQCVLCADEFGLLGASPLLCNDCKKAVCTKCGVDTLSAHKEPLWLCKICSETRETWKKSGAWFYKGLPKYILPGRKMEQQVRYARAGAQTVDHSTGAPVRSYNAWLQSKAGRSSSDKEFTDSSDDELRTAKLSKKPTRRRYLSESVESNDSSSPTFPPNQQLPAPKGAIPSPHFVVSDSTYQAGIQGANDISDAGASTSYAASSAEGAYSAARIHPESPASAALWYKTRREAEDDRGIAKQDSLPSGSYGNGRIPTQLKNPPHRESRNPSEHEAVATAVAVGQTAISPDAASTMEFSLLYDAHSQALHCTIYRAKGLKPADYDSLADPYVRLQLLPVQNKSDRLRTRTVHKTLNPEFNETVTFFGLTDYDITRRTLRLTVLDEDHFGNDFMGETMVPLKKLRSHQTKQFHIYLDRSSQVDVDRENQTRGKILVSLMYSGEHQALIVGILRCSHLPPRENSSGYCDPYVRVHLKPDHLKRRHKTATKKKTLSPEYNEEFLFEMKPHELSKKTLAITVWDKDYGKTDDYIGGLDLGLQSKGDRLRHWMDIVRNPDNRIERWHPLGNAVMLH